MIVEGLVTTLGPEGQAHLAPMGPEAEPDFRRLVLRPFTTAQTFRNLRNHPEGVFHVVDDAELLARAAIGPIAPPVRPAGRVRGFVVLGACRYFEFRALRIDATKERAEIECEVLASGRLRDFLGFNRARHAVVEAAILATRAAFLPLEELRAQMARLEPPVVKTGGAGERRAFELLREHIERVAGERRAAGLGDAPPAVRVRTGSRLHFGLLAPGPSTMRRFGGVGMMVARPGLEIVASRAALPEAAPAHGAAARSTGTGGESTAPSGGTGGESTGGPLAERAAGFAARVTAAAGGPAARVSVRRAAPEHAGLGTGTQLGMAVARALAELAGEREPTARELAARSGRGERSGVGIHGFQSGGLIVDGGKADPSVPAPLVARVEVPESWRFIVFLPRGEGREARGAVPLPRGLSGEAEREAFRGLAREPALAAEMARAVLLGLLPAAAEGDLRSFQEALGEIERRTAECFAPVQGGPYAVRELEEVVRFLAAEGAPGAGQSSWGPALYAVAADEDRAAHLARRVVEAFPRLDLQATVTAPLNRGATVEPVPGGVES